MAPMIDIRKLFWTFEFKSGLLIALLFLFSGCQKDSDYYIPFQPPFSEISPELVDLIIADMTIEEKIGQLLVLKSDLNIEDFQYLAFEKIRNGELGGILLHDIPLQEFIDIVDSATQVAPIPLFIGSEEKFLLNNQFSGIVALPEDQTLYALPNDTLKQNLIDLYINQVKTLGINFCMGPEIDEFLPKGNIDSKQYFESQTSVSPLLEALVPLRRNKILSIGDRFSAQELLDREDLLKERYDFPFQEMIRMGISGFKVDNQLFKQNALKKSFIRNFFQASMGFEGLVVGELKNPKDLEELISGGADILIVNGNPQPVYDYIRYAATQKLLTLSSLDDKVRRVLLAKAWMKDGLDLEQEWALRKARKQKDQPLQRPMRERPYDAQTKFNIIKHFENPNWGLLDRQFYENSMVLVNNKKGALPFNNIYNRSFNLIQYGKTPLNQFEVFLNNYVGRVEKHFLKTEKGDTLSIAPINRPGVTNIVVLGDVALNKKDSFFIEDLLQKAKTEEVVLINFGDVFNLKPLNPDLTILQAFELNSINEQLAAQLLFGAMSARGILPYDINEYFRADQGAAFQGFRLKFAQAEEVGIAAERLVSIDAIANSAIDAQAFPGCQVLIAKEGRIIYSKSFGTHAYESNRRVRPNHLYDIASVTKVAATTLAVMKLYEEGAFKLSDRLKEHLELDDRSPIRNIRIRNLLTHESGIQPNMPVAPYVFVRDSSFTKRKYFRDTLLEPYTVSVADHFYFNELYLDTLKESIQWLELSRRKGYRYSDVNFVLLQFLVESLSGMPLDEYLETNFYGPMGLKNTLFQPTMVFDTSNIIPTQLDDRWRMQLIHGYVHDEAAALLGGVSGNAGLFSNAEELAIIFQMFLNGGTYGGRRYLEERTIRFFTTARHGNHRGLGFDKPYSGRKSALAPSASIRSYGHTGFTGTCAWVDPDNDLVYIFLSNRIHPSRSNNGIITLRVRERIHQVVYDAIGSYKAIVPGLSGGLGFDK